MRLIQCALDLLVRQVEQFVSCNYLAIISLDAKYTFQTAYKMRKANTNYPEIERETISELNYLSVCSLQ